MIQKEDITKTEAKEIKTDTTESNQNQEIQDHLQTTTEIETS